MCTFKILLLCSALSTAFASTPLIEAAKSGNKTALASLLERKANANSADPDGTTALHWAAYKDDLDAVDILLKAGAKAGVSNDLGATPLWLAAQNGGAAVVKRLLEAGADPNRALTSGETPLMVGARGGYAEVVQLLLSKGADPNVPGSRGQTALMWAAAQKHPDVVKILIGHKADLTVKSDTWSEVMAVPPHGYLPYNKAIPHGGETALMFAARVGDVDSARELLAAGANPNDADAWGVSATTLAAHSGFTDLVLLLLDRGADPNLAPNGFTALQEAIMRRDEKMVATLLEHKADPNFPVQTWTPTRRSSDDFHFDPQLVGATPYWLAARLAEPNVMRMLVAHGADAKFVHHADWTAEQLFGAVPRKETVNALGAALGMLRGSVWVNVPREEREGLVLEAVKLAIEGGADINLVNTDGRTPLDAAKALKYKSVTDYLVERGAKGGVAPQPPLRRGKDAGQGQEEVN
jgi:ankyrin repeat protein